MPWVYLSPHPDDVVLSCGGLVWEQVRAGHPASVWTICAGDPPSGTLSPFARSLHQRWQTSDQAFEQRRAEDVASCEILGASWEHFSLPDCIYRADEKGVFLYDSEESLFGPLHPAEERRVAELAVELSRRLPPAADLVCPLGLGGHVDHYLARRAAERAALFTGARLWYYADYPYVQQMPEFAADLRQAGWQAVGFPLSLPAVDAWCAAVAAHTSQISTFWPGLDAMCAALREYAGPERRLTLWCMPSTPRVEVCEK